eukprot:TRINITY_DN4005_c0_g1_i11.p1 TRINITY_DN4005_c0_g1~~TRINITY_DN4005_c0_g1_i11.p1  ORF type:complete len:330 (-),score=26.20 TRINITY_DN4005_c0_g1_i11:1752-2741(-)
MNWGVVNLLLCLLKFGQAIIVTNTKYAGSSTTQNFEELGAPKLIQSYDSKPENEEDNNWNFQPFEYFPAAKNIYSAGGIKVPSSMESNQVVYDDNRSLLYYFLQFLRAVFPVDDRDIVQDSLIMPFRSIGKVGKGCTGTVIGGRHVLTSAHCIADLVTRRVASDLSFQPALNIGQVSPFPVFDWLYAAFPDEFINNRNESFDYAVIILKDALPSNIQPIQFGNQCVARTHNVNIAGYPLYMEPKKAMWTTSCVNIKMSCDEQFFAHDCDTSVGMSGSGMISAKNDSNGNTKYTIRGIHQGFRQSIQKNIAIYIDNQIQQQINEYMSIFP